MAKHNYLVEGISGSGKSTVCQELENRGYHAIEADHVFGYFGDPKTGKPTTEKSQLNWIWDVEKVDAVLGDSSRDITFVCGGAMNQQKLEHHFDKIFILQVDDATLKDRIMSRTSHDFGKKPEDLARQLEWNKGVDTYARQKGAVLIDASHPIEKVVDDILSNLK